MIYLKMQFIFVYIGGFGKFYWWVCKIGIAKMNLEWSDIEWEGCMSKGKQPRTKVKVPKLLLSENKKVFI